MRDYKNLCVPADSPAVFLELIMQKFDPYITTRQSGCSLLRFRNGIRSGISEDRGRSLLKAFLQTTMPDEDIDGMMAAATSILDNPEDAADHYRTFQLRKKDGGFRTIEAPEPVLKKIQRTLLDRWWYAKKLLSNHLHGFIPGRGTLTCAGKHLETGFTGRGLTLVKVDIRDFFMSITRASVMNVLLNNLGAWVVHSRRRRRFPSVLFDIYASRPDLGADGMTTVLQTDPGTFDSMRRGIVPADNSLFNTIVADEICLDHVALRLCCLNERLPQGSPCSPALANIFLAGLHNRINVDLKQEMFQFTYTAYADDFCLTIPTISNNGSVSRALSIICTEIYRYPDISVNQKKIGVFKPGKRQKITGICITDKMSISRQDRDKVRAELHNATTGRKHLSDEDKMRLRGVRAWMRGVDADGWDARCEKDFKEVVGK